MGCDASPFNLLRRGLPVDLSKKTVTSRVRMGAAVVVGVGVVLRACRYCLLRGVPGNWMICCVQVSMLSSAPM